MIGERVAWVSSHGCVWEDTDSAYQSKTAGKRQKDSGRMIVTRKSSPGGKTVRQRRGGRATLLEAFKRPAPAVWGNGLWGSVGGAGRSYD